MENFLLILILALELAILALEARGFSEKSENEPAEKAAELEKRWNDGVSGILGYDFERAKGAVRSDEGKDG